jgi:ABC-type Mn2+/Zn2+ transport system permease subunit
MIILSSLNDFLQFDFLLYALLGALLLSLTCGIISPLLIARKNAFIGSAISHSTLLGLSIALSIFEAQQNILIFLFTLTITLICTFFLARSTFKEHLPSDSLIGIFYTSTMALGILIHSLFAKNKSDLLGFLFGNILLLNPQDMFLSCCLLLITILIIFIPFSKWMYLTFDEEGAITSGVNAKLFHYMFFILLTLIIVTSIKLAGTILIETFLLIPGFFSLKFAKNIRQTFIYSILFSSFFAFLGLIIANAYGLPSGATLAVVQFSALLISILLKKIYDLTYRGSHENSKQ